MSRASSTRESSPSTSAGRRAYIGWLRLLGLLISIPFTLSMKKKESRQNYDFHPYSTPSFRFCTYYNYIRLTPGHETIIVLPCHRASSVLLISVLEEQVIISLKEQELLQKTLMSSTTGSAASSIASELEIRHLHEKIDHLLMNQWQRLMEIQQIQIELMQGPRTEKKTGTDRIKACCIVLCHENYFSCREVISSR